MNTLVMKNWEESLVSGTEGGPRVAHAHAALAYSGTIEGGSIVDYLLYYPGEGYDGGETSRVSNASKEPWTDARAAS